MAAAWLGRTTVQFLLLKLCLAGPIKQRRISTASSAIMKYAIIVVNQGRDQKLSSLERSNAPGFPVFAPRKLLKNLTATCYLPYFPYEKSDKSK